MPELEDGFQNRSLETLVEGLDSEDAQVRIQAIYYLGEMNTIDALEPLLDFFDREPSYFDYIFDAVATLQDPDVLESLVPFLDQKTLDQKKMTKIAWAAIQVADADDIEPILSYIDSLEPDMVPDKLLSAISTRYGPSTLDPVMSYLSSAKHSEWVIALLTQIGDAAEDPLAQLLDQPDAPKRDVILRHLVGLKPDKYLKAVKKKYIKDADENMQRISLEILTEYTEPKKIRRLLLKAIEEYPPMSKRFATQYIIDKEWTELGKKIYKRLQKAGPESKNYYEEILAAFNYQEFVYQFSRRLDPTEDLDQAKQTVRLLSYLIPAQPKRIVIKENEIRYLPITTEQKLFLRTLKQYFDRDDTKAHAQAVLNQIKIDFI